MSLYRLHLILRTYTPMYYLLAVLIYGPSMPYIKYNKINPIAVLMSHLLFTLVRILELSLVPSMVSFITWKIVIIMINTLAAMMKL